MDRSVAGLEHVKRRLAVVLRRFIMAAALERGSRPQNLLVLGGTGSGKTWLLQNLLRAVPVVWTDTSATEYSDVGYQGRDLTSMYLGLTAAHWRELQPDGKSVTAKEHRARAEQFGVVLFDEFDKLRVRDETDPLRRQSGDRQVGRIIQFELLKLVEGVETRVKGSDQSEGFDFRTHGVLHIAMGAFPGIEELVRRRVDTPRDDFHEQVELEDIIDYGFVPELVGRFASLIAFPPLQMSDLIRILREQVLPRWEQRATDEGLLLQVPEGGCNSIANEARKHALGARSLEPILDAWTWKAWAAARPGDVILLDAAAAGRKDAQLLHEAQVA